jgi:hypothetical protein
LLVKFGREEYKESKKRSRIQELGGALHDGRLLVLLPTV